MKANLVSARPERLPVRLRKKTVPSALMPAEASHFRQAGLLDIPYIFGLLQDGSMLGSFSATLMTSKGYFMVLKILFSDTLPFIRDLKKGGSVSLQIFSIGQQEVGFVKVKKRADLENTYEIELFAIAPEFRNQKYGTAMLQACLRQMPEGVNVQAFCTKYSRAMQHILVRNKFRRERRSYPLECYRLVKDVVPA